MFRTFLRWVRLPTPPCLGSRQRLRSARPGLVQLEDRAVPATITWTGTTGASWAVDANWDLNRVPTTGDDVVIGNGTTPDFSTIVEINTLTVAANSGLTQSNGTLTIDSASTVDGAFTFNLGTLTGAGDVTFNGLLTWHDGTMSGVGKSVANGGIALAVTGFPALQGGRQLDNNGTATWTGGGSFIFSGGGTFNNNGTFDVQNDRSMGATGGGSPVFNNVGTFKKSAGSGTTQLTVPFNNTGTVEIQTGTVSFGSGGSGAGAWSVAAPAALEYAGSTFNLSAGSSISGAGTMRVVQGTMNLGGVYSVTTTVLQGGHTIFDGPAGTTTLALGVGNGAPTLEGSGDVTVSGLLTWDSGTMTGAGTTFANGGIALNPVVSNGVAISGRRVDNNGAATWTGNSFLFSGGGVFNNNGTFDAQTDKTIGAIGGGSPAFNNVGTFRKSAGTGTTDIQIPFTNPGSIVVQTGTLNLSGGLTNYSAGTGTLTGGTYDVAGTLKLGNANVVTNAANITLDGPAAAILNSATSADALANFAANAAAGSFTLLNGRTFTAAGPFTTAGNMMVDATGGASSFTATGDYTQTAGTTTLVAGGQLASTTNTVAIQGGTLRGSGTVLADVTNSGTVAPGLSPGVMVVTGDYTQDATGTLAVEIGGSTPGTQYDQLEVSGAATLDGTLNVSLVNGFLPADGDSFAVVTYTSHGGDFATATGLALGNARFLKERFAPTALNLDVILASLRYQTQPVDTPAGQPFPVVVEVTDGSGNLLTSDNVDQVTLTLNKNSFAGGAAVVTQPVVNGQAAFNLTIDQGATGYQLTAGGNGFADVLSNTFTIQQPPSFTSGTSTTFTAGTPGTFTVTTAGVPAPGLSEDVADVRPAGVTFADNGDGTATLGGTPAVGTGGPYTLHFIAANGAGGDATQTFTLTVNQAPAITSATGTTFTVGTAGSFSVTTTGFPAAAITETGALPTGVTLTDNGNGAATIAGTPAAGTGGTYAFTVTAANGVGTDATQGFALTVNQAPAITSSDHSTFLENSPNTFTVTATGFPAAGLSQTGSLPTGVTFTDNGNGTATLSGTPDIGTTGTHTFTITAANGVGTDATQSFTLTVSTTVQSPTITSAGNTAFAVGVAGSFTVTAAGVPTALLSETGALPSGVTFADNGDGTATLAGTPDAGTGGTYSFTITASNGVDPDTTQTFTLTVGQVPSITSTNSATFTVGSPGTFTVTTAGFPVPSLSETGAMPAGVTFTDNGAGTATLAGTPAAGTGGTYPVTVTATNGVGTAAAQSFTLTITQAPAITSGALPTTLTTGTAVTFQATATGFPAPTFTLASGPLPPGLALDAAGAVAGTPTAAGTFTGTLRAANAAGTADQPFTITVTAPAGGGAVDHGAMPQFVISAGPLVTPLNPDGSAFGPAVTPFGTVPARAVLADVTGDGTPDLVIGAGPGGAGVVVVDGVTRQQVSAFAPFGTEFTGGTFVAAGDVNTDGRADIAVSADVTGGPRVVVIDGRTGAVLASFFGIADPEFRGGARVALGDLNGDGMVDLAVAAGPGGGPRVALYDGATIRAGQVPTRLMDDFFVLDPALRDGAYLSIGDVTGDGFGDLTAGAGAGGAPRVLVISGKTLLSTGAVAAVGDPVASFFALPTGAAGARVAAKDLDGDRFADVVVAVPTATGSKLLGFRGADLVTPGQPPVFEDYSNTFDPLLGGVFVG